MRIKSNSLMKWGGFTLASMLKGWMKTVDFRVLNYDQTVDPANPLCAGSQIVVLWHEYIAFPLTVRPHCGYVLLVGKHSDAELLSQGALRLGHETVRGSTSRGGTQALRQMMRTDGQKNLVITPDGPRGPRRQMAIGPIYLSSRLGIPIVLSAFGADRPWRLPTWDRFAVPRPFSRARTITSPRIQIPPGLDRESLEQYRQQVERLMHRLTDEAEDWAASGDCRTNEYSLIPQGKGTGPALPPPKEYALLPPPSKDIQRAA